MGANCKLNSLCLLPCERQYFTRKAEMEHLPLSREIVMHKEGKNWNMGVFYIVVRRSRPSRLSLPFVFVIILIFTTRKDETRKCNPIGNKLTVPLIPRFNCVIFSIKF